MITMSPNKMYDKAYSLWLMILIGEEKVGKNNKCKCKKCKKHAITYYIHAFIYS